MKQLFLKSNLLHIRLKDGEYEVSNPDEKVGDITPWLFFYRGGKKWPYGVELVDACPDKGNLLVCANESCWDLEECQHKKVARLLPKEEKKTLDELRDSAIKGLTEIRDKIQNHLGDSFTESAYKEFEPLSNEQFNSPENQNRDNAIVGFLKTGLEKIDELGVNLSNDDKARLLNRRIENLSKPVESSEPQENGWPCISPTCGDHTDHLRGEGRCEARKDQYGNPVFDTPEEEAEYRKKTDEMANRILAKNPFRKPVSAPSESQEGDLWQELAEIINSEPEERITGNTLAALSTKFTITRKTRIAMEKPDFIQDASKIYYNNHELDTDTILVLAMEHVWNTHVVPLQEEIMRQGDTIVSLGKVLLKPNEREQLIKLESENKSLQEKLKIAEHLKELDDDAIVTLQKEVERLKAEVLKEKFPEN